jgi:hypothetical protein
MTNEKSPDTSGRTKNEHMKKNISVKFSTIIVASFCLWSCKIPALTGKTENKTMPVSYTNSTDTSNAATIQWRNYFNDPQLIAIIDTALKNNQELNIALQEIEMGKNEIYARKGEYRPFVQGIGAMGIEKSGNIHAMVQWMNHLKLNPV